MEKFKKFSDPSTGLNPFLPIKIDRSIISTIFGLSLAIPRLLIFLIVLLLIYIA